MRGRQRLVGGLLQRGGRLLLGRRSPHKKGWAGAWDMPGGHVEPGESFAQALVREIEEEVGVTPLSFVALADWRLSGGERYCIFRVDGWRGGEPAICNHEHTELGWFTPDEAHALEPLALPAYRALFDATGERLR